MALPLSTDNVNLLTAEVLRNEAIEILGNRNSIRHLLTDLGSRTGTGSKGLSIPFIGWGLDAMGVATGECDPCTPTPLADATATLTAQRYCLTRQISDCARGIDSLQLFNNAQVWVRDAVLGYEQAVAAATMQVFPIFTDDNGNTGAAMSVAAFLAGQSGLEKKEAFGPAIAVLHPCQWAELQADIMTIGGVIEHDPRAREMLNFQGGSGFRGSFNGIDIYVDSRVTDDGVDYQGLLLTQFAIGYTDIEIPMIPQANETNMISAGPVSVEWNRGVGNIACLEVHSNAYFGVGLLDDARAVKLLSAVVV